MKHSDLAQHRLQNQHVAETHFQQPAEVVQWLGAVQAQDYYSAKWALGLRMQDARDEVIERAFASGEILRTHVMRPTWHFVTPVDIRWLLKLTAPRVNAANAHYYRKLELDQAVFKRTNKALANALRGGRQLTREALRTVVGRAGVAMADLLRFNYVLIRAEQDGIICSGARQGKQFSYALLDERVPATNSLSHDEALAALTLRYFKSHGPATLPDFVWWSGLTAIDAKKGVGMVQRDLVKEMIDGKLYWFSPAATGGKRSRRVAYLLPAFDEFLVSYKDRSAAFAGGSSKQASQSNLILDPVIVIRGRVVGTWKRTLVKNTVVVRLMLFAPLSNADRQSVVDAANSYGEFLGLTVALS